MSELRLDQSSMPTLDWISPIPTVCAMVSQSGALFVTVMSRCRGHSLTDIMFIIDSWYDLLLAMFVTLTSESDGQPSKVLL